MKRRYLAGILACSLAAGLLTGCGSSTSEEKAPAAEETEEKTEEAAEGTDAEEVNASGTQELKPINMGAMWNGGDLQPLKTAEETEVIDKAEAENMDRAMRAFSPSDQALVFNEAESFYYYDQLDEDTQDMYDAIYQLCENPVPENCVMLMTALSPESTEFRQKVQLAYYAVQYDHPEVFWIYNAIDSDITFRSDCQNVGGSYGIYLQMEKEIADFEEKQTAFNDAVEEFLDEIDDSGSEMETAKAIHDKLTELVIYDNDVLNNNTVKTYAHTAYGALVENSEGTANYAVCDGYSLAYEYLLQQVGIEATVVLGDAGADELTAGGHAWNLAKLDGTWYEIDSTWDDRGELFQQIDELDKDSLEYRCYSEAIEDASYRDHLEHFLYGITTEKITNYTTTAEDSYITKDGAYELSLINNSIHQRWNKDSGDAVLGELVELAPTAE